MIKKHYEIFLVYFSVTHLFLLFSLFYFHSRSCLHCNTFSENCNKYIVFISYIYLLNLYAGFTTGVEEEPSNNTAINSIMLVKEINSYYVSYSDIQITEVNIFDLTGRLNFTSEISGSGKLKLDLEDPGIYFITYDDSNTYQCNKLVIVK